MHRVWIDEHVDLSFASERWVKVVRRPASEGHRPTGAIWKFAYSPTWPTNCDPVTCAYKGRNPSPTIASSCYPGTNVSSDYQPTAKRWNCLARRRNLLPPSRPSWRKPRSNWMTNSPLAEGRIDQRSRRTGIAPSDGARHPAIGHLATDGPHATHAGQARTRHHGQHRALDSVHSTFRADVRQRAKAQRTCRALPDDDLRHGLQPRPQPGRAASGR